MIISHKYKFIFIKTRKTAGTSIEAYFSQFCGDNDIVTPLSNPDQVKSHKPRNSGDFKSHIGAGKVKGKVSEQVWKTYFKFTFDRNPWDLLVSFFSQRKGTLNPTKKIPDNFNEYILGCENGEYKFPINFKMYSIKGDVVMDFIGRYETLEKDLHFVCDKVGLPFTKKQLTKARGHFRKKEKWFFFVDKKKDYRSYYTDETRQIVEKSFQEVIRLLGYSFK